MNKPFGKASQAAPNDGRAPDLDAVTNSLLLLGRNADTLQEIGLMKPGRGVRSSG